MEDDKEIPRILEQVVELITKHKILLLATTVWQSKKKQASQQNKGLRLCGYIGEAFFFSGGKKMDNVFGFIKDSLYMIKNKSLWSGLSLG